MQKHLALTRQRIQRFAPLLAKRFYPQQAAVTLALYSAPGRITWAEAQQANYRPAALGAKLGPLWSTHWFKVAGEIPASWRGREVHLLWDSSSEACVWQAGVPLQGLTGSTEGWGKDAIRKEFCLTPQAAGGEQFALEIEVACNGLFGMGGANVTVPSEYVLRQAEIAVFDRAAWDLFWDFKIVADMAQELPNNTPRGGQALYTANAMVNAIQLDDPTTWPAARALAAQFLAARNGDGQHHLSAIGHAHIDTAWLWPIAETKRKCARSFASAVRYMDTYPTYRFACSQAQQYAWIKAHYPELYARIRAKVQSGQFIPAGGTWIEPDCNLPAGESLVRQFLYGQRFFRQEFGTTCQEFWNPDVFGYSGALPQIMRQAGIKYFLTQKLSWNQFNKPTSHTFWWEGIDGSRVLTHFPPADTYNATASVKEVLYNVSNFKDHERANESYMLFGFGDGGGGPTPAMLEQLQRMGDVDGLPRVQIRSPREFFARCEADAKNLTVWIGELYFELHRGTYTTQARTKQHNRRSEGLLHDIEALAALATVTQGAAYPTAELTWLWQHVLTNQFHDIIPGSSITEVYQDATAEYVEIEKRGTALRDAALSAFVGVATEGAERMCAVNTLGFPRTEVVALPQGAGQTLGIVSAPALGYRIAPPAFEVEAPVQITETAETLTLENAYVRAVFTRAGGLVSLYDKRANRESIAAGEVANRFVLFEDEPVAWDAWDVDAFHLEKGQRLDGAAAARVVERDPLRATLAFDYALTPTSTLHQTVSLTALSPRLDFANQVEWHEHHKFLKVEFPLNLRAPHATYEIQFGHLQRPTHFNTTWDLARFEVCAHKWADLAEPDFGVALLNDCKYGHAVHGNVMRLSLLRAPTFPDAQADQGAHTFRYALLPHVGSFQTAGIIAEAYRFNVPLLWLPTAAPASEKSFFSVSTPAVVLDTLKKAEDSGALIARCYEAHGGRGPVRLTSPLPVKAVTRCNLLEEEDVPLTWADGGVTFEVTPFQIVTLKLSL